MLKFKGFYGRMATAENGDLELTILIKGNSDITVAKHVASELKTRNKKFSFEVKEDRAKRSLNANAYLWALLEQMAHVLNTSKDEVYLQMLERYGVFTYLAVKPSIVERVEQEWRCIRNLGEATVNGKKAIQLQCYFGSSTYDTKEMSRLLDGVVSEAKELGIETMTKTEIEILKQQWGAEFAQKEAK